MRTVLYILRECLVNIFGYKLKLRSLVGRGKQINITGRISEDILDKGVKHRKNVDSILDGLKIYPNKGRFLEIGPGGLLLHGCMLIIEGWKEYIAVDAYTSDVWGKYSINVLENYSNGLDAGSKKIVDEVLSSKDKNTLVRYYGTDGVYNKEFNDLVDAGSVDVIYTWGVLEHIDNIDSIFQKNFDLLNGDGVIIHVIDTHPHTWHRFENPYVFLTVSNWLWKLMYAGRGFITRRMPNEYISSAKKAGFKVEVYKRELADYNLSKIRNSFIKKFRETPDEEILTHRIYLILRK